MRILVFTLFVLFGIRAQAAELIIKLPLDGGASVEHQTVRYDCAGQTLAVEYINAGPVSLAVFAYDGEPVVATNVLSASGARYAGNRFIWWTKGAEGSLYDLTRGEDAAPILQCAEAN